MVKEDRTIHVVAAIIKNASGELLIARRKEGLFMAGLWEFPGGKVKPDESHTEALVREIKEELSLNIQVNAYVDSSHYDYGSFELHLHGYTCQILGRNNGQIASTDHDQVRWVLPSKLEMYIFAPADLPLMDHLYQGITHQLEGGNMSMPTLKSHYIYKEFALTTPTIHSFLIHMRSKGLVWLPHSAIDIKAKKHLLSYLPGQVPHEMPDWVWNESILREVGTMIMEWHEASKDFQAEDAVWFMDNGEPHEVICHNDFAPYNCVFDQEHLKGVIDFDVCSPGSRLWDLAYAAYRYVPLMPLGPVDKYMECSPFDLGEMKNRLKILVDTYNEHQTGRPIGRLETIAMAQKRLIALADWSENYGKKIESDDILRHSRMYRLHAQWLEEILI